MSKRRFLNTIKRRIRRFGGLPKIGLKKVSWQDAFWARQLKGIETLGRGLVVMRMG